MPSLSFSHPIVDKIVGPLVVHTGMDQIAWSYNLNTAHWPTYGGEVVQILSVYIDDMTIHGTCRDYAEMERIYTYFANYMQVATQGNAAGTDRYNQQPITMTYAQRGWTFEIQPTSMPAFRMATDVVAPVWAMVAHVVDDVGDYDSLQGMVVTRVLQDGTGSNFAIKGQISPNGGDPAQNPFQAPGTQSGNTFTPSTPAQTTAAGTAIGSYFSNLIQSYQNGDFTSLYSGGSGPAFGSTAAQITPQSGATPGAPAQGGAVATPSSGGGRTVGRTVGASYFSDSTGYHSDNLTTGRLAYAELGGPTADTAHNLGGLPYGTPLTISYKGRSVTAYKLDIGQGGAGVKGYRRDIDLHIRTAQALGFDFAAGVDLVQIH